MEKDYIRLSQYGYVYQLKTDCLAHFTFQVKACRDVDVGLFNEDSDAPFVYQLILGGWGNSRSVLRAGPASHYYQKYNILDCNSYRRFWISWRNDVVAVGRGVSFNNDMLLSITGQKPNQVRYIGISSGQVLSEWKIPHKQPPLHCFQQSGWKLSSGLQDTNMTVNITWSVTADNLGQCALTCTRRSSCMSFVYNNMKKTCQGHGLNFSDIAEGQGHRHSGSHYYIKP
ncbi:C3 and PZP-like alpha-2-macroglobulin domain-containing protein 8 [Mizuhopecten yessoensis]|uniref:C3 and PZP-like alpha-2-macroglobulin domain-containing protein 8 n=1 Tax=Mizuhopecten yessoensis TaxID=6573 RepID=A0A210R6V4_MIZYE|nr:C3 and PZP-like alpha-2-macroglobulin domain-containing protein 8 [Mizuhopecten yessoensis]